MVVVPSSPRRSSNDLVVDFCYARRRSSRAMPWLSSFSFYSNEAWRRLPRPWRGTETERSETR